jgi:hypothetical protein
MTSQINTSQIDETYPKAGQDNNSQGFRDNFTYIKDNLVVAASEITDLQNNSASRAEDNDFLGNQLSNAVTNKLYGLVSSIGSVPVSSETQIDISLNDGPLQYVTITDDMTLTFKDWPEANRFASIRLHLKGDTVSTSTVTLDTIGGGKLWFEKPFSREFKLVYSLNKSAVSGGGYQIILNDVDDIEVGMTVTSNVADITSGTTVQAIIPSVKGDYDADPENPTFTIIVSPVLPGSIGSGNTITFTRSTFQTKVIEAWTYNGGATVFVKFLGIFDAPAS